MDEGGVDCEDEFWIPPDPHGDAKAYSGVLRARRRSPIAQVGGNVNTS